MAHIFHTVLTSIRKRLLLSFLAVIFPLLLLSAGLVYAHLFVVGRYSQIVENLIFENQFSNSVLDLTRKYYDFIVSQKSRARFNDYSQARDKVRKATERLDTMITAHSSQVHYRGVRNITNTIIDNCEKGVGSVLSGHLIDSMERHDRNFSLINYVKTSMADLMEAELIYAGKLKEYNTFLHMLVLIAVGFVIVFLTLIVVIVSFVLSRKITDPLVSLSATAKSVAQGDFEQVVDAALCARSDEIGTLAGSFSIMIDNLLAKIQEAEAVNAALQGTQAQLIQSEKMSAMGQLSAGVAHEINNPMSAILCNQQLFKMCISNVCDELARCETILAGLDRDDRQAVDEMRGILAKVRDGEDLNLHECSNLVDDTCECVRRIKNIVSKLRNFAHPNVEQRESVSVNDVIDIALGVVAGELKFNCVVAKNFKKIPDVLCNKDEIVQVIVNLLINASQAIKGKDGHIDINTYCDGSYVFIEVIDDGEGISKDNLSKVFDPFFTTKEVGVGTGLGLSIVYTIIEKHKGHIWIESELGRGAKVSIKFPVHHG